MSGLRTARTTGYEIGQLEGWQDATQLVLLAPPQATFTPNIQGQQQPLPADATFEQYMQLQRDELGTLPGFRLIESVERSLAGLPALRHAFSWDLPEHTNVRVRQLQYVVLRDGDVVTITCSALESDWDHADAMFQLALSGFAWH